MTAAQAGTPDALTGACEGSADLATCRWLLEEGPTPEVDPALLETVFSDPAFEGARERGGGALEHLAQQLREWFMSLMDSSGAAGFAEWTRALVLLAAVLLVLALAVRWARRRRSGLPGRSDAAHPLGSPTIEVLDLPSRHLARGREALPGAPREAIRQGLLALLSGLEEAGVIAPGRVRTNRELAHALPTSGAPADEVARLAELLAWYDRAFYSLATVPADDAEAFLQRIEARLGALDRSAAAA